MRLGKHHVRVSEPRIESLAALVLLSRGYRDEQLREWFSFRDELLDEAESRDGCLRCVYCERDDLVREAPEGTFKQPANLATIDHVVPVSKGGDRYDKRNCVIACYPCNQKKADKVPE